MNTFKVIEIFYPSWGPVLLLYHSGTQVFKLGDKLSNFLEDSWLITGFARVNDGNSEKYAYLEDKAKLWDISIRALGSNPIPKVGEELRLIVA